MSNINGLGTSEVIMNRNNPMERANTRKNDDGFEPMKDIHTPEQADAGEDDGGVYLGGSKYFDERLGVSTRGKDNDGFEPVKDIHTPERPDLGEDDGGEDDDSSDTSSKRSTIGAIIGSIAGPAGAIIGALIGAKTGNSDAEE